MLHTAAPGTAPSLRLCYPRSRFPLCRARRATGLPQTNLPTPRSLSGCQGNCAYADAPSTVLVRVCVGSETGGVRGFLGLFVVGRFVVGRRRWWFGLLIVIFGKGGLLRNEPQYPTKGFCCWSAALMVWPAYCYWRDRSNSRSPAGNTCQGNCLCRSCP